MCLHFSHPNGNVSTSVTFSYCHVHSWVSQSGCFPGRCGHSAGCAHFAGARFLIKAGLWVRTESLSMVKTQFIISRRNVPIFQHHYPALILERKGKGLSQCLQESDLTVCEGGYGSQRPVQDKMSHCLTEPKKMTFLPAPCWNESQSSGLETTAVPRAQNIWQSQKCVV